MNPNLANLIIGQTDRGAYICIHSRQLTMCAQCAPKAEEALKVLKESYEVIPQLADCACWVRTRPQEEQFCLRWGAHNPECPIYRESRDPVDRSHDEEIRQYREAELAHQSALTNAEGEV